MDPIDKHRLALRVHRFVEDVAKEHPGVAIGFVVAVTEERTLILTHLGDDDTLEALRELVCIQAERMYGAPVICRVEPEPVPTPTAL